MSQGNRALFDSIAGVEQLEQLCSTLDVDQLADRLVEGGVLSRDELDSVLHDLEVAPDELHTTLVADALIRTRRVSVYQLWATVSGQQHKLSLGEYTVVEPLGAGGMGEVLLGVHRRMKRKVAIKFLPAHFADDEEMIKRFEREVEVAAQLSHPHIVTAYDAGHIGNTHYLVMEYVDGCDLGSLIRQSGSLNLNDALKCVLQAGKAIAHAHEQGVIHRDIKPSNLLADRTGTIKVLDMGLARWSNSAAQSAASDLSVTGAVMGTIDFMSPEQAASGKNADSRSDIYSLGCTLYVLFKGRPVFPGETVIEKIVAHQNAAVPDLVPDEDEQSRNLNQIFHRMLAKKPDERFATMDAACAALAECVDDPSQDYQVALQIPQRTPVCSYALQDTRSHRPEASYISTVDVTSERDVDWKTPDSTASSKWRGIGITAVVALLLMGIGAIAVPTILKLTTPDGTLVLKCHVEGAIVEVDGKEMIRVTDPDSQDVYRFDLPKGDYKVRATLPDGTEIKSGTIVITSKQDTLFEVLREASPRRPPQVAANNQSSQPKVDDAPNVLTVAQDGSAEFTSIGDAVNKATLGNVIRILDSSTYRETVMLTLADVHDGVTIEAPNGATWIPGTNHQGALFVQNVKNVTLRSLSFELDRSGVYGIVASQISSGLTIEDCEFTSRSPGTSPAISLENLVYTVEMTPVIVHNCEFVGAPLCLQVSGINNSNQPISCGGVLITACWFSRNSQAINVTGQAHDVIIAANRFHNVSNNCVQFMHLAGDLENIVVANNTFLECRAPIRIWEDGFQPAPVSIVANLSLTKGLDDWFALDSGGDPLSAKGPAHGAEYATKWNFTHNFREGRPPDESGPIHAGWFPPGEANTLAESIDVLSRDPNSDSFLRPPARSAVARGGVGGELPTYAGALPPDGAKPFDWKQAFQRSLLLSRVPKDVLTVAKEEVAHFKTIQQAFDAVEPGMTIRVIDDGTYKETLALFSEQSNVSLEATGGAKLAATPGDAFAIRLQDVADVSIRGFSIDMGTQYMAAIHAQGNCSGITLDSIVVSGKDLETPLSSAINLVWLANSNPRRPVVVNRCSIEDVPAGIRVSGIDNDYKGMIECRNVALTDNRMTRVGKGIVLYGDVRNIVVAGNVIHKAKYAALQLEQLGPGTQNILIANNTLADSTFGLRVWSEDYHGQQVQAINNLSFAMKNCDWAFADNGGSQSWSAGPGDVKQLQEDWTIKANFRESQPVSPDTIVAKMRIPPSNDDTVLPEIALVSRNYDDVYFARPTPDSPLATGGAGGVYPVFVGAKPPEPGTTVDWDPLLESFFDIEAAK